MMETSIEINGRTIWHIKIHNRGTVSENLHEYNVAAFSIEKEKIKKFTVYHDREDGATELVRQVMEELP